MDKRFADFFRQATGIAGDPYPYQIRLVTEEALPHLLDVPTGLGKSVYSR